MEDKSQEDDAIYTQVKRNQVLSNNNTVMQST